MRQWNFDVNIEKRNPWTGNVYFISRMTSDWAERHPLNVNQFIEDVYREFEGTEFEESREELWRVWTAVLSVSSPQGDASLYPNRGGRRRAAAMKVWLLAGDYWRRGFRTGDVLPAMVPGCRITRIGGDGRAIERYSLADRPGTAWIALFPKEIGLMDEVTPAIEEEPVAVEPEPIEVKASPESVPVTEPMVNQATEAVAVEPEPVVVEPEPVVVTPRPTERERNAAARRRREQREAQRHSYEARLAQEAAETEAYARQQERRKIFAAVGAAAVTLVMIYFFGLLGPAVFGLLAGGLLKG